MSQANVEVVKRLFESYRRGDYAEAAACLAPDVVFYSARGRGSGIEYEERLFDVYSFSDGDCVRKREFRRRSDAVEATGLDH
jgi:ketosteroid isomerase-like protein